MTAAEIREVKMHIDTERGALVALVEMMQEIAAQLAEHNQREDNAQSFTRAGDWVRR